MFDCGMGVLANYVTMGIPYSRMNKIFLTHLHADHMSELSAIYCFGEAVDRRFPLYVWGAVSGLPAVPGFAGSRGGKSISRRDEGDPWSTFGRYGAGTRNPSASRSTVIPPTSGRRRRAAGDAGRPGSRRAEIRDGREREAGGRAVTRIPPNDAYALVPRRTWTWKKVGGVAYHNKSTGLKITHFPAIHCRRGSMCYKLEWTPPDGFRLLSMVSQRRHQTQLQDDRTGEGRRRPHP